ncbi:Fur family transcriptional regulator [Desulfocurvibacter africanus]|uniref:Ferric uptake regulator, Fur family n=1 Tax=Desulfocurvibacter africanus subsp. africanus str. Walvis Bay TaxID=690850 RepID=F3Z063_DESAF|nr:Fur family transcriptional regulator [Desulfocurvibacter africanus]EGJ49765.1 ferric uptake regulator, Fur family [Desulfocurvibacter africanus subsp. africanus str. Walvis Bay]
MHMTEERDLFGRACREAGLKQTPQRMEVFREILAARDHPTVEALHGRIRERMPSLSLDTVYRTLAAFERCGLVCRVRCASGEARYDQALRPHQHMACTVCGVVTDFSWPEYEAMDLPRCVSEWGQPSVVHLVVEGICQACAAGREEEAKENACVSAD